MNETTKDTTIDLSEMTELTQKIFERRSKLDELKEIVKQHTGELEKLKAKAIAHLDAAQLKTFKTAEGKITAVDKFSVKVPRDPEAKAQFFDYLRDKGIFENMITVNSNTLNGYYKQELEIAVQQGNVDFSIPGLEEPKAYKMLSIGGN